MSGIVNITIKKNRLCTNKTHMIHFCPNFVNLFAQKRSFFLSFFSRESGATAAPCPPPPLARATMNRTCSPNTRDEEIS